ncbi:MAG: hypothetical protein LJE92_04520 [Gammaproteobacteria bacterium]|nr:hypothetical protein [Gammaproteobacteria bacterium]
MIKKLLTIKLILVLVLQPVAVVFAGNGSLENQLAVGSFVMDCEHMNSQDCPGMDTCATSGHAGCGVKNLRNVSIVVPGSFNLSITVQPPGESHFSLTATPPPLRPPRIS